MNRLLQIAALLLPVTLWAQPLPLHTLTGSELGVEVSSYSYDETFNGAYFMSTAGNKVGVYAAFSQQLEDSWFWGADARQAYGNVTYDSAATGSKSDNPDVLTEIRLSLGRDFRLGTQVLAPYVGLGYRELFNNLRGYTTTGAAGYRRISEYYYLPLGVTHRSAVGAQARLSTTLEYDLLLEGRQRSFLSDVNAASNDPVNTQRSGYGARLTASYETWNWSASIYLHHWAIGDSEPALRTIGGLPNSVITEPQNTTRELGVRIKWHFH